MSGLFEAPLEVVPLRDGAQEGVDADDRPVLQVLLQPVALGRSFRLAHLHQGPVLVQLRFAL